MKLNRCFARNFTRKNLSKLLALGLFLAVILICLLSSNFVLKDTISEPIEKLVFALEEQYQQWFSYQKLNNPLLLLPVAFIGGLIASISPCVLALLPVNLSYISTRQMNSKCDVFVKAGLFVLGVVTTLSLLGLFSSFAGAVMVGYLGYVQIAVGMVIVFMGLTLLGVLRLPLPPNNFSLQIAGPYGVGLTFALVSSPCSSPVLIAVMLAAAASGSQIYSTLTMVSYALGYTAIIFLASLFTGLVKQTRMFLKYSEGIVHFSGVVLIIAGGYYLLNGIHWVIFIITNRN
ncbi:MAG: cytochrome c biogenesis protein CcdA [Symploca sp. SIO3C6]|uniref:Cytochrome c biogenesis protein CcdA n=1 Tax=Symploca sp. SIO1C4 TaxID=2607765 RepID=A0A6B3N3X2_9CYAN|nr:cytochrome c biogenesis protein CcdA [Symploca sp. SIO3C6]NER28396.1 cytochrome c biogenesis protein CcdA [Symploca sp. SIO1C4]